MNSFRHIINLWPDSEQLGNDINVPGLNVRAWKRRDNIPPEYWLQLEAAAKKRGYSLTIGKMALIASKKISTRIKVAK